MEGIMPVTPGKEDQEKFLQAEIDKFTEMRSRHGSDEKMMPGGGYSVAELDKWITDLTAAKAAL